MNYLDHKVSRNLAFCALALFAVTCLLEVWNVVWTRETHKISFMAMSLYSIPRTEYVALEGARRTLGAIAFVHACSAVALLTAYACLTASFARRATVVKAAVMAGVLAFLPVTQTVDVLTRVSVDAFQGRGSYTDAMSSGDGTTKSSNKRHAAGASVFALTQGIVLRAVDAGLVERVEKAPETREEALHLWSYANSLSVMLYAVGVFLLVYKAAFYATAFLLFGWSTRAWWSRRSKLPTAG